MKAMTVILASLTFLMALNASAGMSEVRVKGVEEVRKTFDADLKLMKADIKDPAKKEAARQAVVKEFANISNGKIGAGDFNAALAQKLTVNEGGKTLTLDMTLIAQSVRQAEVTSKKINTTDADQATKDLMTQKARAIETTSKFISLASVVSGSSKASEVNAFAKELSLIPEMMTTMDAASLKSHLDIMELAIENRMRNPELEGDQAFAQALKTQYGEKYAQKLNEINGCQRFFVL